MAITNFRGEYNFLSNFSNGKVWYGGYWFNTVETAFQAAKCEITSSISYFVKYSPREAKKCGRLGQIRSDWEECKVSIMGALLRQKFTNFNLKHRLIETNPHKLIEGNTWGDRFWGCVRENGKWVGENHLGKLLMEIRNELINETKS